MLPTILLWLCSEWLTRILNNVRIIIITFKTSKTCVVLELLVPAKMHAVKCALVKCTNCRIFSPLKESLINLMMMKREIDYEFLCGIGISKSTNGCYYNNDNVFLYQ